PPTGVALRRRVAVRLVLVRRPGHTEQSEGERSREPDGVLRDPTYPRGSPPRRRRPQERQRVGRRPYLRQPRLHAGTLGGRLRPGRVVPGCRQGGGRLRRRRVALHRHEPRRPEGPCAAAVAAERGYPQVAQTTVEMLIIQNPQSADFSSREVLHGPRRVPILALAPSAQRE